MSSIYFAKCGPNIKIGIAANVARRIAGMQTSSASPIVLLGSVGGNVHDERKLHKRLDGFHVRGEWFKDCPEVRAAINEAVESGEIVDPKVSSRRPRENNFGKVCKALWPAKTAENLAAKVGCSTRKAAYEIAGAQEPSLRSILVIVHEITKRD